MPQAIYKFGDQLSEDELKHVIDTLLPKKSPRTRRSSVPVLLAGLHALAPNLLEHVVNRKRGLAFDSGEDGFSHQRIGD